MKIVLCPFSVKKLAFNVCLRDCTAIVQDSEYKNNLEAYGLKLDPTN